MAEDKKVITINDVDYTEDQLTDQQKVMINHVNSLQQKINSAQFNHGSVDGRQGCVCEYADCIFGSASGR